jgi:hypothetical protein
VNSSTKLPALALLVALGITRAEPVPVVDRTVHLSWNFAGQPIPKYDNGLLLARDSDHTTLRTFGMNGAIRNVVRLSLPDATLIQAHGVAASPEGMMAVSASAKNSDGVRVSIIVWLDESGRTVRVVRTSPFEPFHLAFASEGTLWAAGREHEPDFRDKPDYGVLRQYDREGRPLRSVLAKSTFELPKGYPAASSFLVASSGRIVFYSETASEWVELSLLGEVIERWKTTGIPPDALAT